MWAGSDIIWQMVIFVMVSLFYLQLRDARAMVSRIAVMFSNF
ncbi:hypothetical protein [Virgibacillus ainsalahensis]